MNHPFDEFSKSMSDDSIPRRESLRRLGAAFIGAALAPLALGSETASANPDNNPRRRRHRRLVQRSPLKRPMEDACTAFCKRCHPKAQQNQCVAACRACGNDPNGLRGACGAYTCCGNGTTYCSGQCVDLKSNSSHCGSCGNICGGSTPYCINGTCSACPGDYSLCGGICVDTYFDRQNCGACGVVCSDSAYCEWGLCIEV
jgi:hypothetical protein